MAVWENETLLEWWFSYDGDGNLIRQVYFRIAAGDDTTLKVTSYFAGGSYEVEQMGKMEEDETILIATTVT